MTQKIPTKIKVGAMTYTVEIVPDLYAKRSLYGEVTYGNQSIIIAEDISPARQFNAFMHELTHAMLFEMGDWERSKEEQFVRSFSNMLTQVAVDNGWSLA
ncbi:ImmA/IrrE family metallo-endopeptidase [Aeribacillus pallidus]|nr:ImmA/IrrE family metallo-endopeptidase [Aeribacillus pallidus]